MKQFDERYWKSKFARFVRSYGVDELAAQLHIRPSAIYHWLRGTTAPRPVHAENIQRLARERGVWLSMDAIYGHFLSLRDDDIKLETETLPARRWSFPDRSPVVSLKPAVWTHLPWNIFGIIQTILVDFSDSPT
jgi:hypothetical protein